MLFAGRSKDKKSSLCFKNNAKQTKIIFKIESITLTATPPGSCVVVKTFNFNFYFDSEQVFITIPHQSLLQKYRAEMASRRPTSKKDKSAITSFEK